MAKFGRVIKKILLWLLAAFILLPTIIYMPSEGSLCGALTILLLMPIDKWQNLISKVLKGKVKAVVCVIMVFASLGSLMSMPPVSPAQNPQAITAISTAEPEYTIEQTLAPEVTAEPQPTEEPTIAPTEEPTQAPTPDPTKAPTPKPTKKPTPKPTKAPEPTEAPAPAETPVSNITEAPAPVAEPAPQPAEPQAPVEEPASAPVEAPAPTPVVEQEAVSEKAPARDYVVNTNTGRFHNPSCSSVDEMNPEHRKEVHASRDDLIGSGYKSCGRCHP